MSSSRVERVTVLCVDPNISRRGKLAVCLTRQNAIQAAKQLRGIVSMDGDGVHGHFDHRRNQRSRDAMPSDVCNKNAEMVLVRPDELVEIARDRGHGTVRSSDTEVLKFGHARRENGRLDLPCSLQFGLNREQTALVGKHYLQSYVSERKQKDGKAQRVHQR